MQDAVTSNFNKQADNAHDGDLFGHDGAASNAGAEGPIGANQDVIGARLFAKGLVTENDLANALAMQAEVGGLIGQALLRLGALTEEALLAALAEQLAMPVIDTSDLPVDVNEMLRCADSLGVSLAWQRSKKAAIWFKQGLNGIDTVMVASFNPLDAGLQEVVEARVYERAMVDEKLADAKVCYALATSKAVDAVVSLLLEAAGQIADDDLATDAARLRELAEEAPVIDFVNNIFSQALKENATDIHIEPYEREFEVRFRIDGVMQPRGSEPKARYEAVASRLKLLAGMDIAEKRLPQDGRHTIRFAGFEIDLRVSSLPAAWGESLVIRLLRKKTELPDLEGLGLKGHPRRVIEQLLLEPNGIVIVTGPTGSGKSTTLYRSLELVNDGLKKIITIEDPVEYDVAGITQIQVKSDIGFDFARGLRSILRQDPDVIMVGEIRDGETAKISAQAALTGHFVLSTLHTNSSLAAIPRLIDLGLDPYLIADSVRGLIAQRLVRRVCHHCAEPEPGGENDKLIEECQKMGARFTDLDGPAHWMRAKGCDQCGGEGYRGRVALFEAVNVNAAVRRAILNDAPVSEIFKIARQDGFLALFEDGVLKAREGVTTLEEIFRVCGGSTKSAAARDVQSLFNSYT